MVAREFPQIAGERNGSGPGQEKLLVPGWGGAVSDDDVEYITRALRRRPGLARKWGFRPTQVINPEPVRRVAMDGDPDDVAKNRHLARPWFAKRREGSIR